MGRTKAKEVAKQMEKRSKPNKKGKQPVSGSKLLSCGSTVFDLAMSGSVLGGFASGKFYNVIGDSHAGKSLLALTTLACCSNDKRFADYAIVYDDVEAASEFNIEGLFGSRSAERIESPRVDEDGAPVYSEVVEDFIANVDERIKEGVPFIYILDSLDSLSSSDEQELSDKNNAAHRKGVKGKGTYGMGIPKALSRFFRTNKGALKTLDSFVIIVSQTRDDINPMTRSTKTRSGGKALKFYSTIEAWLAVVEKKKDNKYGRIVSTKTRMKVTKSKLTGKIREADSLIYYDYGIDNIGSMVDWMIEYKFWARTGQSILPVGLFEGKMTRKKLLLEIENNGVEDSLKYLLQEKWDMIEEALEVNKDRKPRFS